jgi:putative ABC transport system permease protein
VGAGLTFVSFRNVVSVNPGFEPEGVLTGAVLPVGERYPNNEALLIFSDQLLERFRALPGVEEAALVSFVPFAGDASATALFPEGYERDEGESILAPYLTTVSPGYFRAMGIPLIRGRTFEESDIEGSPLVAVIDEWLARRFWPDTDPIGKRYAFDFEVTDENAFTIIGIVGEVKQNDLADTAPLGANYLTYKQVPLRFMMFVIKTGLEPYSLVDGVRGVVGDIDPDLPPFWFMTMEERIEDSLVNRRAPMLLLMIFSAVALFLAAIGLYGVLAYTVTQRSKEIGIRLALGSGNDRIFRMVVRQGMLLFLIGLPIGIAGDIGLTAVIRSQLFEARAFAPAVFVLVCLVLGLVALLACVIPARRATAVDPVATLNYE